MRQSTYGIGQRVYTFQGYGKVVKVNLIAPGDDEYDVQLEDGKGTAYCQREAALLTSNVAADLTETAKRESAKAYVDSLSDAEANEMFFLLTGVRI